MYKNLFEELESWLFNSYNPIVNRPLRFLCGGTGEFDGIVCRVLRALKRKYPDVPMERILCTPFSGAYQLKGLRLHYDKICPLAIIGTQEQQIELRDKTMVGVSEAVIGYARYSVGRAKTMINYAKRKNKTVIIVSDGEPVERFRGRPRKQR